MTKLNQEIVGKLKSAGFPGMETQWYWICKDCRSRETRFGVDETLNEYWARGGQGPACEECGMNSHIIYSFDHVPGLEELIEAVGDINFSLCKSSEGYSKEEWWARKDPERESEVHAIGKTYSESVANLYLALKGVK